MDYFWYAYIFILGIIIGSFLNVCIYRIPKAESVVTGSSHCTSCNKPIRFRHMIPIFSYIFMRGRCSYCKARISIQYPIVEALTAFLFLVTVYMYGYTPYSAFLCIFHCILIVIGGIDAHTMEIPDILLIWLLIVSVLKIFFMPSQLIDFVTGAFIISVPMLLISLFSSGFGGGDIKLCAAAGLFLGFKYIILGFLIACVIAAVYGSVLIILKLANRKSSIAFGPFLSAGFIISILFGRNFIELYLFLLF